jgi:hypothetical protein
VSVVVEVLATTAVKLAIWYVPFLLPSDEIDADDSPESAPNPPFQDPSEENATTAVKGDIKSAVFSAFMDPADI